MIKKLSAAVSRRINSEQVITDTRSVVKELVENALDAGASKIIIELVDYGLEKIIVHDNGSGILPPDRANVATGHCTSKIADLIDLQKLQTYGFRGEALHSCCDSSEHVSFITRCSSEPKATKIVLSRIGQIQETISPASNEDAEELNIGNLTTGTIFCVSNLWKLHPVRRETMKKDAPNYVSKIQEMITSYALILPSVSFTLKQPPSKDFKTNGSLKNSITDGFAL